MEDLTKLDKSSQEAYLASQSPDHLLTLYESYFNLSAPLADLILSTFSSKVDEADPLYQQSLLVSARANSSSNPLLSLSKLLKLAEISAPISQVYPLVKSIVLSHRSPEFSAILEKLIELSTGTSQINYLKLFADLQQGPAAIEAYNNIWDLIYELDLPAEKISELLEYCNELMPEPLPEMSPSGSPKIIYKSKFLETWWTCDVSESKAYVYLGLLINDLRSTLQKSVTADLIGIILTLGLANELGLKLAQAGIQVTIEPLDNCLEIKITGHGSKVLDASEKIMEFIYNSAPTSETFDAALIMLKQQYHSMIADPSNQSKQLRLAFLQHQQYLYQEKLKYLSNSPYTDLNFANVKILLFACGHVSENLTSGFAEFIEGLLFAAEGKKLKYLTPRTVALLPDQIIELVQSSFVDLNDESVVEVYFQFGQASVEERVLTNLLEMIISDSLTDYMVNTKRLCKSIEISSRMTRGVSGLLIKATTVNTHPDEVQSAVFDYFSSISQVISANFTGKKKVLLEAKQQSFRGVSGKSVFFWDEILQGNLEFERTVKETEYIKTVEIAFLEEWLQRNKVLSKALVVKIVNSKWGPVSHRFTEEFSQDVETVRNRIPCYSWLRIMH